LSNVPLNCFRADVQHLRSLPLTYATFDQLDGGARHARRPTRPSAWQSVSCRPDHAPGTVEYAGSFPLCHTNTSG
jgi:hypothetical protein